MWTLMMSPNALLSVYVNLYHLPRLADKLKGCRRLGVLFLYCHTKSLIISRFKRISRVPRVYICTVLMQSCVLAKPMVTESYSLKE